MTEPSLDDSQVDSWLPVSSRAWLGRFVQGYRGFECFVAYNWGKSCSENTEAVTSSEAMGYFSNLPVPWPLCASVTI